MALIAIASGLVEDFGAGRRSRKSHEQVCRLPSGVEHMTRQADRLTRRRVQYNGIVSSRFDVKASRSRDPVFGDQAETQGKDEVQ